MEILWLILVGLAVGAIARLLMPGPHPGGIVITLALGLAGALIAGFLGRLFGIYGPGETAGVLASILGAMLLLGIYRLVSGRGRKTAPDT